MLMYHSITWTRKQVKKPVQGLGIDAEVVLYVRKLIITVLLTEEETDQLAFGLLM